MKQILSNKIMSTVFGALASAIIILAVLWIVAINNAKYNEAEILSLKSTIESNEKIIDKLEDTQAAYEEDIESLQTQVDTISAEAAGVAAEKNQLLIQKSELEQSNGQLKLENGDLSKKFKVLSGSS